VKLRVAALLLLGTVAVAGAVAGATAVSGSAGPPRVTVPDVLGLPAIKGAYRIAFAHLEPLCRDVHRKGTIVGERPAAGADVARGSAVTIFSGDGGCPVVKLEPGGTPGPTAPAPAATPAAATGNVARGPALDPIPPGAEVRAVTVAFVSFTVGYALVAATTSGACEIAVEKTTDGGGTFGSPVPVAPCSRLGPDTTLKLTFDGRGDGFLYGQSAFYVTHDGGGTWHAVPEPGKVVDVEPVGSSVWMFVGQCRTPTCWVVLTESTDGGTSWHQSPAEPPILASTTDPQLVRTSSSSAYVLTAPPRNAFGAPDTVPMWSTTDGGRSWAQHDIPCPIDAGLVVMAASPGGGNLIAVCASQPAAGSQPKSVVASADGGVTWSSVGPCTTATLKGECTENSLILGYLGTLVTTAPAVLHLTGHRSPIYTTTDGGETWTRTGGTPGSTELTFFNAKDGVALSYTFARTLLRTDNGGVTWSKVHLHLTS
jgi:hypothetical protein